MSSVNRFEETFFIKRDNCSELSGTIHERISRVFPHYSKLSDFSTIELVFNSLDSYINAVKSGSEYRDLFPIKIVIKKEKSRIIVKFKDEGTGFVTRKKSIPFEYDVKKDITVKGEEHMGGAKVGLQNFTKEVNAKGGKISIKNRKKLGCTISTIFKGDYQVDFPLKV